MKVKLLPLAIGAAIAMPGVAMAAPTVYGKMNVAYGMADVDNGADSADKWELESYDSRVGVKGDEKISDSLTAFYQAEFKINVDDGGGSGTFDQRDIFVGFKGGFGAIKVGKFDTPFKKAQGKIDLFGDTTGDIKYVFSNEERVSNILQYSTPEMSGLQANLAIIPGEEFDDGTNDDPKDGPADAFSASLTYNMDNLYLALAHDSEVASEAYAAIDAGYDLVDTDTVPLDATRLVGVFKMDMFQFGAMYQMAETSDADQDGDAELNGYLLSGSMKLSDEVKLKAQWGASTIEDNDADEEADIELLAVGADYILSKQTNLYAHYTTWSSEFDFAGAEEQTYDKIDFGVIHKF
ncbi:MAG: porin [Pseudomonadota bacterium]|nr:porin [Pseudomonadota bacterium]